ncbi:MAG: hypothetical protein Ct9H90mP9_0250 [Pseudomonadota bacterium]|nr:MAG: hypothetical protein Ct9H90mP9_0250 [Pseudomonadota bacterium]
MSNHEGPRLEYLRDKIIEIGGVRSADELDLMSMGIWAGPFPIRVTGNPDSEKRVVYFDGHTDTGRALRDPWLSKNPKGASIPMME